MDSPINTQTITPDSGGLAGEPRIIARPDHSISRSQISDNALKVLYRLKEAGYQAYLVGGGVRDLLLGLHPKDFDIATDASPEEVRELFRNCRLIGRRFRLAHVHFGHDIVEVATFRAGSKAIEGEADVQDQHVHENGRILRDNVYGTLEEDAFRRDFTINALYYNIRDFSLVDYAHGLSDLSSGVLRLVGDPVSRYQEDPVRMLRAVRFAAKLGFTIHPDSESPIFEFGHLLADVPAARLFDEVIKLFHSGHALQSYQLLSHYGLLQHLFPDAAITLVEGGVAREFVERAMTNTDARVKAGLPVNPAFLYAVILWRAAQRLYERFCEEGMEPIPATYAAAREISMRQTHRTALPKRFGIPMQEIWHLQKRFELKTGKRAIRFMSHPRFRAAYDFYCLRAEVGESPDLDCQWWTEFQQANPEAQAVMTQGGPGERPRRAPRRRKKPNVA